MVWIISYFLILVAAIWYATAAILKGIWWVIVQLATCVLYFDRIFKGQA